MGHVVLGAEPICSHVCFAFGHGNVEFVRDGPTVCTSDCGAWCVVRGAWCVVRGALSPGRLVNICQVLSVIIQIAIPSMYHYHAQY